MSFGNLRSGCILALRDGRDCSMVVETATQNGQVVSFGNDDARVLMLAFDRLILPPVEADLGYAEPKRVGRAATPPRVKDRSARGHAPQSS